MKKLFALLLAALTLLSVSSCGAFGDSKDTAKSDSSETSLTESEPETTTAETIPENYLETLPQKNYAGATFTIIGKSEPVLAHNFPEEEETGEIINDALFIRNRTVEEKFGVDFAYLVTDSGGSTVSKVTSEVMAGGKSIDMIQGSMLTCSNVLLNKGVLTKINDLEAIDLEQPWWNACCETDLAVNGNCYYVTGDILYENYLEAACIQFNKQIAENYKLEDLYALANNGEWTFDKMLETASVIPANSGVYRFTVDDIAGYSFYFGAGLRITQSDGKGGLYLEASPTEKMLTLVDKYSTVFKDTSITVNNTYNYMMGTLDSVGKALDYFTEGKSLFNAGRTRFIVDMRNVDFDFGVLPMPKYDETQTDYISYANPWEGSSVSFPKVLADSEMSGVITEAMAYESRVYLKPAMYDNMLQTRSARDEESAAMLDIIFSTKTFDLCDICEWGKLNYVIRDGVLGAKDTMVSDYAASIDSAKAAMEKTTALFSE